MLFPCYSLKMHQENQGHRVWLCLSFHHAFLLSMVWDYPGFAMLELEKRHPGATALFWAGCGADQNPLPRRTVELAQNYGNQLADSVDAVLKQPMKKIQGTLKKTYSEIPLSFAELPTRDKLIQDSQSKDKFQAGRAKFLLKKLEAESSIKETYQYPIETWKLGDGPNWVF